MNTSFWAVDGLHHRGLWNQCNYEKNLTLIDENSSSYYGGTCCSQVQNEGKYNRNHNHIPILHI